VLKLGGHYSISGGYHKALSEAALRGCTALQIFTKNQNRWQGKPLCEDEVALFKSERARLGIEVVLAHDSYLINLASPDSILWKKSLNAFIDEIERAEYLEIENLVFHPGSHMGSGEEEGIERIARALNRAIETREDDKVMLLLETTAGQGTSVGWRFEHLGEIINRVDRQDRLGVCFDTAHAFAAGYELRTREGYEETWRLFDHIVGLHYLKAFHLNDSKKDFNSRVDRHQHIGQGFLGVKPFEYILNDERFDGLVGCLETPKEGDWDKRNLLTLRRLEQMPVAKRKPAARKVAKKTTVKKKVTAKKPIKKKVVAKKPIKKKVTAKKVVKKKVVKKKVVKKPIKKKVTAKKVVKKKVVKKKVVKKPIKKKVTARKVVKKKVVKKKPIKKKVTARKPAKKKVVRKKK